MRIALTDERASLKIQRALEQYADKIFLMPPHPALSAPVASHPDMLVWHCGDTVITYGNYLGLASHIFDELYKAGFNILTDVSPVSAQYPHDIGMNCALVGNRIICHTGYISCEIKAFADAHSLSLLHTRQGYAKCSCVCIGENEIITADPSIARTARKADIDVLCVRQGYIRLRGYDTGFIGGAGGVVDGRVLFCGDIDTHPDSEQIRDFCSLHGKEAVSLSDGELQDLGTVIFMEI